MRHLVTSFAGQPMLMSMTAAPWALGNARAFRHQARLATGKLDHVDGTALALAAQARLAVPSGKRRTGGHSETTRPAPSRSANRRKGVSVMPDIGAKTTRFGFNGEGRC